MSDLGTYSFLPWLRHGIANEIHAADFDPSVKLRATVEVALELQGARLGGGTAAVPITRPVSLFGPGDIVGVDRRAIVRTEPRNWITSFEPNYLAHIEFYDEDFPWRYTPAAPDLGKGRLRPWIALVVLTEDEFADGKNVKDRPLPFVEVAALSVFPRADELWAWAHVHVNRSLAASDAEFVSTDMNAVIPRLRSALAQNPDLGYSRLLCPRKLAENTAYHAFLVPTFETGRRAGLGLELGDVAATLSAWDGGTRPEGQNVPYYFRWFFRTGASGDFESLVRLLEPRPVDRRVGTRPMDVQHPGPNVRPLDKPELGGYLELGGALRPPALDPPEVDVHETWDDPFPRPLQEDLAGLLNLPDDYRLAGDPDPIVAPPLYGQWHALTSRVLEQAGGSPVANLDDWVHRLNLDPRFRAAAGMGTRVIQDQQERFMDAAWEQVGDVLEAQRRIRLGQFSLLTSRIWYDRHLAPLAGVSRQKTLLLLAPLNKRLLTGGVTIHHALGGARVQPTMTSPALRRLLRPRGRLLRASRFATPDDADRLLERVNRGEVSAAPPPVTPPGLLTNDAVADELSPDGAAPGVLGRLCASAPARWIAAALALAIALAAVVLVAAPLGAVIAAAVLGLGFWLYRWLRDCAQRTGAAEAVRERNETPEAVDRMPAAPGFTVVEPGELPAVVGPGPDSPEAERFKLALREHFEGLVASREAGLVLPRQTLDLARLADEALAAIAPTRTIPRRIMAGISLPPRIADELAGTFVEPMAYPVIDLPMYEPLKDRSAELFLPNINLIEMNSITLLETNQRFIEAYMVGLNHEFARELLWREYPTDRRGSTFRQFWDVRSYLDADHLDDEQRKEKLRDIPPLHRWPLDSELGEHDHREADGGTDSELVLVIRGELLKRYPTAVIYAHRACWQKQGDGTPADRAKDPCLRVGAIDNTKERRLAPLTPADEANPPRSKVRTPLYEAKVDPDIYFFGFDLTVDEARGGTGEQPADDPGWFFIIKERPGEPRFGLDGESQPRLEVWNDLAWPDVQPGAPGSFIEIATAPASLAVAAPTAENQEKAAQHADDRNVTWHRDMGSADLAYILFQAPVMVGVHASEMLP